MINLGIKCEQCRIAVTEPAHIAEGCIDYVQCTFDLDQDWQAMGTIVAKFRNSFTGKTYTAKVEGGSCVVPAAAMAYPQMDIALYGTDGATHMTTSVLQVPILKSDLGDGIEPVVETSVFDTIMSTANHAMQTAQSVRDDAAAGAFNGTPFRIVKQYASIADMEADTSGTVSAGEFVIITSGVEDPDNSKLFLRTETGWSYINDMSGAQGVGIKGDKGDKGPEGPQGPKGDKGDAGVGIITDIGSGALVHAENALAGSPMLGATIYGAYKQDGTPTLDAPVDIQTVTSAKMHVCGRNLLNVQNETQSVNRGVSIAFDGEAFVINGTATEDGTTIFSLQEHFTFRQGSTYTITTDWTSGLPSNIVLYDSNLLAAVSTSGTSNVWTVTPISDSVVLKIGIYIKRGTTYSNNRIHIQIEQGSTATDYRPYQGSVTAELLTDAEGNAYELAALPDGTRDEVYVRDNGDGTGDVVFVERVFHAVLAVADMNNSETYPGWKNVDGLNEACPNTSSAAACINSAGFYFGRKYFIGVNTNHTGELWSTSSSIGMTQSEFKEAYPDLVIDFFVKRGIAKETVLGTIDMLDVPESVMNAWAVTDLATECGVEWYTTQGKQVLRAMHEPALPDGTEGQYLRKTATAAEWVDVTAAGIGAAQASHKHPASDLTSTLGIGQGGTSATTADAARANLGAARNIAGIIHAYAGSTAPDGYLMCDGAAVSRTTYAALFAAIGTTYGAGDGSTTFNLPDLQGRFPLGAGAGNGLTARTVGQKDGEEGHALTIEEMPAHSHVPSASGEYFVTAEESSANNTSVSYSSNGNRWVDGLTSESHFHHRTGTDTVGSGAAHNNMPPYTVVSYIISTGL